MRDSGRTKHLEAWNRIANAEIGALCDPDRERLTVRAEQFGVPGERLFTGMDEMLEAGDIDAVDLVTPPDTHLGLVRRAAAAGKHILCQKPFAPSMEEARQIVECADRAGVRLMVAENWRWLEPFQTVRRVLDAGALGNIHTARYVHWDYFTPPMEPERVIDQPFLRDMPRLIFYKMGVHWFDVWWYFFGHPRRLFAETRKISPYVKGEDAGYVVLGHDTFQGVMDMNWASRVRLAPGGGSAAADIEQLVIEGDAATLTLCSDSGVKLIGNDENEEIISTHAALTDREFVNSHCRMQSHFIDCLERGTEFQRSGRDNLQTLRLAFSVYESASQHKVIEFADLP